MDTTTLIAELGGASAIILAVLAFGLNYARTHYGAWGDKMIAGMKILRDGAVALAQKYPTDPVLVKFSNDLGGSYDDANAAWASNDWLNWAHLIKASNDFYATYKDFPAVVQDLVQRILAMPSAASVVAPVTPAGQAMMEEALARQPGQKVPG
jgi:hypothetical protein